MHILQQFSSNKLSQFDRYSYQLPENGYYHQRNVNVKNVKMDLNESSVHLRIIEKVSKNKEHSQKTS
jgi:hypothetical protein